MVQSFHESVRNSIKTLLANKARSFLTMLGIIIGVGAVIVIMAVGAGAQSLILAQVKTLGTDKVGVMPGNSEEDGPPTSAMGVTITTLKYSDAEALNDKNNVPNLINVAAYTKGVATVSWGANTYEANISGTNVGYLEVEGGEVENGRFFNKEEEKNLSRVAVLGSTVKEELFGESEAVGQTIKVKKHLFEVIGVMKERGTVAFQNYDDQIFVPIMTMQKIVVGIDYLGLIRARVDNEANIDKAMDDMKQTLREQHDIKDKSGKDDDFSVRSAAQALDMITTITDALKYFLAAMGGLSLLVGGIGIMNIMLVSVTERTREIGLRKAVGANNRNILFQFLAEAISITFIGGIIGIISGIFISFLVAIIAKALGYEWEFSISILSIILGVGVSAAVGVVFGLYPARKASLLEPVEALRYE